MSASTARAVLAEFLGTGLLVATVVGSGVMATNLSHDVGLELLENSIATGCALVALILMFQPVSAAFNPVVTLAGVWTRRVTLTDAAPLIAAQILGGSTGAVLANVMFKLDAGQISSHHRANSGVLVAEVVATFGLVLLIESLVRTDRGHLAAGAVGAYIAAAYWFTSSTSFANPAVTIARMFSDTFAGIAPASVLPFIVAQLIGAALALAAAQVLFVKEVA